MFKSDLLWQNDSKWASDKLGFGPQTIKQWGCLMTSIAMVVNGFGYKETPRSLNKKMKQNGGFQGPMIIPAVIPSLFPGVVFNDFVDCEKSPAPLSRIDAHLAKGQPAVVQVDWSSAPGAQSHWVVAYAREGDDYLILDPYKYGGDAPGKKLKLLSRYYHLGKTLKKAVTGVVFFSGPATGKPPEPPKRDRVEMPQNPLKLYPTLDGLALRADPSIGGYLVGRLSEDAELLALGKKTNVKKKIGQYNQWLFVQGPKKQQGYVAAWYVAQEKGAAQAPPPKPSGKSPAPPKDVDSGMVVKPTTDGLAFRAKPAVSGNLIKRLPISSQLKVLEPAPRAARKLGVTGEWMRVSDVSGKKGYVAAWYVTDTNAAALGVKEPDRPAPTQDDDDLVVYGTADNLALRSRPVVADNTLIKRLPLQADLLVLKDSDKRKIGAQGQWIKVRDVTGAEGYVAAWYVTK